MPKFKINEAVNVNFLPNIYPGIIESDCVKSGFYQVSYFDGKEFHMVNLPEQILEPFKLNHTVDLMENEPIKVSVVDGILKLSYQVNPLLQRIAYEKAPESIFLSKIQKIRYRILAAYISKEFPETWKNLMEWKLDEPTYFNIVINEINEPNTMSQRSEVVTSFINRNQIEYWMNETGLFGDTLTDFFFEKGFFDAIDFPKLQF